MIRVLCSGGAAVIVGMLAACGSPPRQPVTYPPAAVSAPVPIARPPAQPPSVELPTDVPGGLIAPIFQGKSRWVPVSWSDLPGLGEDPLHEAWNAWLKSCEKPGPVFASLCSEVRRLSIGNLEEQRAWLLSRLQPYRVESSQGDAQGLLTGYYEPLLEAQRESGGDFKVPLFQPPTGLATRRPWYTRQEIDTQAAPQASLRGREIAYLADPVDALVLQIQGSGRVRITERDGSKSLVRLAFAGSNDQPYKSVGRWLIDQGALKDASWPAIKAWTLQNPQRVQDMLWSNPRTVFFREELLSDADAAFGPRGAQGVALTPGRSIAVDPTSIPYGTPVWMATQGPWVTLNKLVLAQDTGSAISGAVRADYFAGWNPAAAELAGRLKQPLNLWVLWPRRPTP